MKHFLLLLCVPSIAAALETIEYGDFSLEVSGNVEGQYRQLNNPNSAKRFPLNQDWETSDYKLGMANLNVKAEFKESRIEANWFGRYAQSPLFADNQLAPRLITFPRKLVARDVFRLDHSRQDGNHLIDGVLNKFYYELGGEDSRFAIGRMFINYGTGEVFNPINPFNQPLGLVAQSNIAQGNDGMKATFFPSERATLNFYLLGNKRLEDYENQITRTLWLHGEYRLGDNWQFDYVLGEDQKRNKFGGQVSFIWKDAMFFAQLLESSSFIDNMASQQLTDILLGYDHQLTGRWHLRIEAGYQEIDKQLLAVNPAALGDRLLPYEYFVAVAQTFELHPLVKTSATLIHDFKTRFVYGLGRVSWSVYDDVEWDLFGNVPLYWIEDESNLVQKIFPAEVGTGLRVFF